MYRSEIKGPQFQNPSQQAQKYRPIEIYQLQSLFSGCFQDVDLAHRRIDKIEGLESLRCVEVSSKQSLTNVARILKLNVTFEIKVPVKNGLKLFKMVPNCHV